MYKNLFTQSLNESMEDLVEADESGNSSAENHQDYPKPVTTNFANMMSLSR